jgi:hypothetical protein
VREQLRCIVGHIPIVPLVAAPHPWRHQAWTAPSGPQRRRAPRRLGIGTRLEGESACPTKQRSRNQVRRGFRTRKAMTGHKKRWPVPPSSAGIRRRLRRNA